MQVLTLLSCAKTPEVLSSLRNFILKKLEYNSSFSMIFFSLISNFNIHVNLRILLIKLRKLGFYSCYGYFLVCVDTFLQEFGKTLLLLFIVFLLCFLDIFKLISQFFVIRTQLYCFFNILHCLIKLRYLHICYTSEVICFARFAINVYCFCAVNQSFFIISCVVCHNR